MKTGFIKQLGERYSVRVDGWSVLPYFDTKDKAVFTCASRIGKLEKELTIIRIPFVRMWIAW